MGGDATAWLIGGGGGLLLAAVAAWRARHFGRAVQVERARELFRLQHERFEEMLLAAAAATGKPRGLRWASCLITGDALLVREKPAGGVAALVPVVVGFEPVEGGDMADVPAAREPRPATAVFTFARGAWHTAGRVVFNLDPRETAERSAGGYEVIDPAAA